MNILIVARPSIHCLTIGIEFPKQVDLPDVLSSSATPQMESAFRFSQVRTDPDVQTVPEFSSGGHRMPSLEQSVSVDRSTIPDADSTVDDVNPAP